MKCTADIFCLLSLLALSFRSVAQAPDIDPSFPVARNGKLQLISDQFSFTEGPAADAGGNVFFTDQPNNKIWKYDTNGSLTVFMDNAGRANGLYFNRRGELIVCADENNQLWSLSPGGKISVLIYDFQSKKLNGPNDVWINKKGDMYFTDPYYQREYWKRTKPDLKLQSVYLLKQGSHNLVSVEDSLVKPNGIVGTPNGKCLYVADIGASKTYRYTINKDGTLGEKKLFAEMGSDGMTIDNQGNLYLTGNGVTVFNKDGVRIKHIPVPAKWTANVCFGGENNDWLFITASDKLFKIKMQVKAAN
ncbi:gluconolactonase [Arcticibacter tournemirensis]|uniref:SMP-30/gluconolactonase/LRE family protein n=1 Tax=Arcticibacter tournemirensis TaxID=699437 RepID=A0A5M9H9R2_9SPHI|nr:SMP-30/gluconolactonase/LRE family protein [Arcticibacter tournemirensis]KAA8483663.1 SMP-30/gluconolactonase/LRE family protein [Arcticibacter tournemirensis]TQM51377.1 gluconolactonase [Arcticibacter tournemirensis]